MIFRHWNTSFGLVKLHIDTEPMLGLGIALTNPLPDVWSLELVLVSWSIYLEIDRNPRYLPQEKCNCWICDGREDCKELAHQIRTPLPGSLVLN